MSNFYLLKPVVYGQLGDNTIMDTNLHPPKVTRVHLQLDCVPLDDLHTSFPCFFVSSHLANHMLSMGLTGFEIDDILVNFSEQYFELNLNRVIPNLRWLKLHGTIQEADFCLNPDGSLVVSEEGLKALRSFRIAGCTIFDFTNSLTVKEVSDNLWEEARRLVSNLKQNRKT